MPPITNNLSNSSVDVSSIPSELQALVNNNPVLLSEYLMDGFGLIQKNFQVIQTDDKTPLISYEVADVLQPAKDDFNPTANAVSHKVRYADFKDMDIDLSLKRSDILKIYRSYERYIMGLTSKEEVLANPVQLYFLKDILARAGRNLALKTAYKGVYNASGSGSLAVADGLLLKFAAGRGVGGDIPSAQVYDSTVESITASNAYNEVNNVAQLTMSNPDMAGMPMLLRLSPEFYLKYKQNRRALFPNVVSPMENPTVLDDFQNITLVQEFGLQSTEFAFIEPGDNLFFTTDENVGNYSIKIIEDVKGWKLNIMLSGGFQYGAGKHLFMNDR
ncbi:MAG: hypothetical protein LCH91_05470 [Bacteroidetes bacterium]|nr:hypothetical protein [Bacteroidota bacterium]